MQRLLLQGFLILGLSIIAAIASAGEALKHGAVMARTVVLDAAGKPILVEYDELGAEVGGPIDYSGDFKKLSIISVFQFEQEKIRLEKYKDQYETTLVTDAELVSRDTFLQGSYPTADGKSTITFSEVGDKVTATVTHKDGTTKSGDFSLPSFIKSVYVRGRSYRIEPKPEQLVLLSFSVDLLQEQDFPGQGSILMDEKGKILHVSKNNIAPRVGFFGDADEKQEFYQGYRKPEDPIFGPVKSVKVYVAPEVFPGSLAMTDEKGKFLMHFRLPYCPGGFEYNTDVWAELKYKNFNPKGSPVIPYYIRRPDYIFCFDPYPGLNAGLVGQMVYANQIAIQSDMNTPFYNSDLKVDVMFLMGRFLMRNPDGTSIEVGGATEYEAVGFDETKPADKWITQAQYDFDNDGKDDDVKLGAMEDEVQEDGSTKKVFKEKPSAELTEETALQAVFFSSNTGQPAPGETLEPDLIRVADTAKEFKENGLLKTISEEDLRKTDIYIFRESTGQLVLERNGLTEEEVKALPPEYVRLGLDTGVAKEENYFYYRLMLRGPMDLARNIGGGGPVRSGDWETWAEEYNLSEPFRKRESDYLKSGEWIRMVAINRKTGYVGTQRVLLGDISQSDSSMLHVKLDDTYLEPPNLKVWAERKYTMDKGVLKNFPDEKERHNIIGQEGAALTSDTYIEVFTEWLDSDGRPLPEGLGTGDIAGKDFGLTGRLARAAGGNTLAVTGDGNLDNFPIPPGRNIQVLKVSDNLTKPEHFYVHVNGTSLAEKPDFEGNNTGKGLAGRPTYFTPFLTPVFDENDTWQTYNAYRGIKRDRAEEENPDPEGEPEKPLPSYIWNYRPEYQFSQYELEVAAINRITEKENGEEEKTNILDAKAPVVSSTDKLIEILYSLVNPTNDRISPIDGPQDLVFAFGEEEVRVTLGADKQIRFENIEHLASLTPEDFLSLRLYSNQDAGNILWEYAFEHLILDTQLAGYDVNAGRTLYISADDPVVPLQARLLGYADRSEDIKTEIVVNWSAPGASLETTSESDKDQGVFFNEVRLPPVTKASTQVEIKLVGVDETRTRLPKFEVVPGVPDQISVEQSGDSLSMGGFGERTLTFTVRDKNNNLVADGTGVSFFPDGSLLTVSADTATTNGRATVRIKGGDYAEAAKLVFNVGEQTETVDVEVRPLKINVARPGNLAAGKTGPVVVTVTDQDGKPATGVDVSLGSTYGYLQARELTTDASGKVTTSITAPGSQGSGVITAQVLRSALVTESFSASYDNPEERDLEVGNAALVGDQTTAGTFTYDRFDGAGVNVAYPTSANIQVQGDVGEQVTVSLGDSHDPNLAPIAAYYLNQIDAGVVDDDAGRFPLFGIQVASEQSTRMGTGTSMSFIPGTSKLWGDGLQALGLAQNTGFTLEVFPKGNDGGTVINLGQGGQRLTYANMRFTYSVRTDAGSFTVTSEPIFPARWHQVSARYHQGKLELWVNQDRFEQTATGAVEYNWTGNSSGNDDIGANHDLEIAGNFNGQLDNLKWYNWTSSALMTFANGQTETSVTLDATKKATLTLTSTGQLHEHGGNLGLHRVAVHTSKVNQYASVMSLDTFKTIAGMYSEATPLDQQTVALPLNALFPQANAGFGDFALGLVSFLFPVQELMAVMQQLSYAVTDPDKFEGDTFIVNLIIAATYLPPGRVLQPFAKVLGSLFRTLKLANPRFLKYFGGMFSGIVSRAKKGQFDTLWHMIPFFIVLAEMYNDPEARKGLELMFKTVNSGEDVLSWVDYLALPADGWEGEGDVPEVALFERAEPQLPFSWIMNQAYAKGIPLKRINGAALGKSLSAALKRMSKNQFEHMPDAIKIITQVLKSGDAAALRKYVFSPSMLSGATALTVRRGANAVKTFLQGKTNARFSPVVVLAMVAYLEWEISCGTELEGGSPETNSDMECNSIGLKGEKTRYEILKLYARAFADSLNGKFEDAPDDDADIEYSIKPYGHGALYHLSQIAYFQLLHRGGGSPIKEIEGSRWVWMYKDKDVAEKLLGETDPALAKSKSTLAYRRSVDIVIGAENEPEQWIELKSYKALSDNGAGRKKIAVLGSQDIGQWSGGNGGSSGKYSLHRQFSLDRAAAHAKKVRQYNDQGTYDLVDVAPKFKWRFQKFKVKLKNSSTVEMHPELGSQREKGSIMYGLTQDLAGSGKAKKGLRDANFEPQEINGTTHVEYASLASLVSNLAAIGFKEAADAIIDAESD